MRPNGGPPTPPGFGGGEPRYVHSGELVYPYSEKRKSRPKKKAAQKRRKKRPQK